MNKSITKSNILFLLIEAILILISIYLAFLLEDKRSKDFERTILIGKLEKLNDEIRIDSLRLNDMLLDSNKISDININEVIKNDSIVLNLINNNNINIYDSLFYYESSQSLFLAWDESWIQISPLYESIIENYTYLLELKETEDYLEVNHRFKQGIISINQDNKELIKHMEDKLMDNYLLYMEADEREIVKEKIWQNSIRKMYDNLILLKMGLEYLEKETFYSTIREQINKEIEAQKKAL